MCFVEESYKLNCPGLNTSKYMKCFYLSIYLSYEGVSSRNVISAIVSCYVQHFSIVLC